MINHQPSRLVTIPDEELLKEHKFWNKQPVKQYDELKNTNIQLGDIEKPHTIIKTEPYKLPEGFTWIDIDLYDDNNLTEVYDLLLSNYVEDLDCVKFNNALLAYISGQIITVCIHNTDVKEILQVNYLCIHKGLRNRRLAPVLIKELTRRANLNNIWNAVYTSGTYLPTPIAQCRYYHRSINVDKLLKYSFMSIPPNKTLNSLKDELAVPTKFTVYGIRKATENDIPAILELYNELNKKYNTLLYQKYTLDEAKEVFVNKEKVLYVYVKITENIVSDFFTFYHLPSQVLAYGKHVDSIQIAYHYYSYGRTMDRGQLLENSIIAAANLEYDVFNALSIYDNDLYFDQLKFGPGDGILKYYLYNYNCPTMNSYNIGMILH